MKSSPQDLKRRGYILPQDIDPYVGLTPEALYQLVLSSVPAERTIAVRLLNRRIQVTNPNLVKMLLERLTKERALYTRLEICHALEHGTIQTAEAMIAYLGKIGRNQHKELPKRISKKISYPLPRDIIARTLGKMDPSVLPALIEVLLSDDVTKISEVIDAIGFVLYYNPDHQSIGYLRAIHNTIQKYRDHDVILWKSVICLSSLWFKESADILEKIKTWDVDAVITNEVERSLGIIEMKIGNSMK